MFLKKKHTIDLQTIIFLKFNKICNFIFFEQEALWTLLVLWTHKNSLHTLSSLVMEIQKTIVFHHSSNVFNSIVEMTMMKMTF